METASIVTTKIAVLIVADDLTGACDAGVHFAARGMRTKVAIAPDAHAGCDAEVVVCNTDSRCSAPSKVPEQLEPVLKLAREQKPELLLKKVDSTLRGPVEREIEWMLEQMHLPLAVLAPSFPGAGRSVRNGQVVLRGGTSCMSIASCFSRLRHAHVTRQELGALRDRIVAEMERGTRVLIVDAEDDADLLRIAQAGRTTAGVLLAGSGGLARVLAAGFGEELQPQPVKAVCGPVLICVGSDHPATVEQLQILEREAAPLRVSADAAGLYAARASLKQGRHVVLEFSRHQIDAAPDTALAAKAGVQYCGGVVVTGGDTAMYVLRSLGAQAVELKAEIEPGIPWGEIRGGVASGKVIVTKSGGFGNSASLLQCVNFLHPPVVSRRKTEAL